MPPLGADPGIYADFGIELSPDSGVNGDLYTPEALAAMKALYAEGIGPFKDDILPTRPVNPPVDGNGDGEAEIMLQVTGEATSLVEDAHDAGLLVVPYTLRVEEAFQALIDLGVDGFFTDSPAAGRAALDRASNEIFAS